MFSIPNVTEIFIWYSVLLFLGIICFPLTNILFSSFFDRGYSYSKILAVVFLSYATYVLGTVHVLPFSQLSLFFLLFLLTGLSTVVFIKHTLKLPAIERKKLALIFIGEELLFLFTYLLWVYVRSFAPDIHGLEKYMDFGFINSILASSYFPPKDMWFTPFSINYYYFGHLATAVLTKLSGVSSGITYNCMLATILACCFTTSFSLATTLLQRVFTKKLLPILVGGILSACLITFGGNLHSVYSFFKPYNTENPVPPWHLSFSLQNPCFRNTSDKTCTPEMQKSHLLFPNSYWYPNATRFIRNTIHEFPIYSWVVADLHGHVLDIPFVLLFIGIITSYFLTQQNKKVPEKRAPPLSYWYQYRQWGGFGFFIAIMYMTNAWDGMIYLLFTLFFLLFLFIQQKKVSLITLIRKHLPETTFFILSRFLVVIFSFMLFSLPFSFFLKPPVSGIGVLNAPSFLMHPELKQIPEIKKLDTQFFLNPLINPAHCQVELTDEQKQLVNKIGPFLFEPGKCSHSPWWQLLILYGSFIYFGLCFAFFLRKQKTLVSDTYISFLFLFSLVLLIIPEFIYLKDIYPDHYRANTMFKLAFQAFMLLSLGSGYVLVRILSTRARHFREQVLKSIFFFISVVILCIVFVYPYFAVFSFYGDITSKERQVKSLDGTGYLIPLYPDDVKAMTYLRRTVQGQPVILEAQGDSYTDYGRVSVHTGLPTVLGWLVHEWLWRGEYGVPAPRIEEIKAMYESEDTELTKSLLKKYHVSLVFIGDLERQKYTGLNEDKFNELGKLLFQSGMTKIYKVN